MKQILSQTVINRMLREMDAMTGCGDVIRGTDPKLYCCRRGEFICRHEDPIDKLYLILSGKFAVVRSDENGHRMLYLIFEKGQLISILEYVLGRPNQANVICLEDAYVLGIDAKNINRNAAFQRFICSCLAGQMEIVAHLSAEKQLMSGKARLAQDILLFEEDGFLCMDYALLASLIGVSYRQLMRYFREFEADGLIRRVSKGRYQVTDRGRISEMI